MAHRLAPAAAADLDEIWSYLVEQSSDVDVARRFVAAITARFYLLAAHPEYLLAAHPELGRARNEFGTGIRSHAVGNYIIFYRIENDEVLIQRVLHGRRDLGPLLRDR
ncbi:MAG TPA: type II toxin-antitoxin system RelE/ParE family toxin [Stellaceae bacterium]|nr:type II toxin-antitoxin system RelE/ParE family toxin [Stellaceae bacterium]